MKKILKIYKKDVRDIFTNYAMLIIVLALCILPSLYAWFNIKASWDPYGSTGNISVAVVNKDLGYTIRDKSINVGKELIDKLKDNNDLGWKFVDEKTALTGVQDGTYYASIEIPSNFSKDLTSLVSSDIKKGEIIYTVNEKINAIAPKITDKGASTIQLQVNQTVVETVSEIIFEISNKVGIELENQIPKLSDIENSLIEIQSKFKGVNETVDLAYDGATKIKSLVTDIKKDIPLIEDTLSKSKDLSNDIKEFLQSAKGNVNNLAPVIKNDLALISDISSSVSSITNSLINAINSGAEDVGLLVDNLNIKVNNLSDATDSLIKFLTKLNNMSPKHPLNNLIDKLNTVSSDLKVVKSSLSIIKDKVQNGEKPSTDILNKVLQVSSNISDITGGISNNFDSQVMQPINTIFENSFEVADNVIQVLDNAQKKLPDAVNILNTAYTLSDKGIEGITFAKKQLPKAENIVDELVSAIKKVNSEDDLNDLVDLLRNDVFKEKEFLREPVVIKENKLYPIFNYGAGMTPFYTVLSLWVGLLLLSSILSVDVHGDYRPSEVYFGRLLTFISIAIVQALIVSIGNITILNVSVKEPLLFVLLSIFTSIVFTFIVYTLLSVFGNVGKVMGIILLVLQVAGSGGTFPVQVTPEFFQIINPYLPFTYAISATREAVGGIYQPVLTKDIFVLLLYIIGSLILALLLKKPINKLSQNFTDKAHESELME